MTVRPFGRIVPSQGALLNLVGYLSVGREMHQAKDIESRKMTMREGLDRLRKMTKQDFGYDPRMWRTFLIESGNEYGYTHPYAFKGVDKAVLAALDDSEVISTLAELKNTQ